MLNWKKAAVSAACALLLFSSAITPVKAADAYTYTVTLSTGSDLVFAEDESNRNHLVASVNHAVLSYKLLDGGRTIRITGLNYNDNVNLAAAIESIDMTGTRYYATAVREAGLNGEIGADITNITGDADYVVSYHLLSDPVEYRVNYVDAKGQLLAPSATFHGNNGDKIIVASRQIDGYLPDANNKAFTLNRTLAEDGAEIIFEVTFTYHSSAAGTNVIRNTVNGTTTYLYEDGTTETVTVTAPGNNQVETATIENPAANAEDDAQADVIAGGNAAAGAADAGAGAADAGTADAGAIDAGAADAGENTVIADEDTPLATQDIVDLDADEEVPLAAQVENAAVNLAPIIAGIFAGVTLVGIGTLLFMAQRRKVLTVKKEDSDK